MTDFNVQSIAITGKKETNVYEERQWKNQRIAFIDR